MPHSLLCRNDTCLLCRRITSLRLSTGRFKRSLQEIEHTNLIYISPVRGTPRSTKKLYSPILSIIFAIKYVATWESCHELGKLIHANIIFQEGAQT